MYILATFLAFLSLMGVTNGATKKSVNYHGLKNQIFQLEGGSNMTEIWLVFATRRPDVGIMQGVNGRNNYSSGEYIYNIYLNNGLLRISYKERSEPVKENTCTEFGILNDFKFHKVKFILQSDKSGQFLKLQFGSIECSLVVSNNDMMEYDHSIGAAQFPGQSEYIYFYGCLKQYDEEPSNTNLLKGNCSNIFSMSADSFALRFHDSAAAWTSSVGSGKNILSFDFTNFGNSGTLCSILFTIYNMTVKLKQSDSNGLTKFCVIKEFTKSNMVPVERCQIYSFSNTLKFEIESKSGLMINFHLGDATVVQFVDISILNEMTKIIIGDANVIIDNSVSIGNKSALGMLANIRTISKEFNLARDLLWSHKISDYNVDMRQKRDLDPCFEDTSARYSNNRRLNVRFECSKCRTSNCSGEEKGRSCINPLEYTGKQILMETNFNGEEMPKISSTEQLITMDITNVNSSQYTLKVKCAVGIDWTYFTYSNNSYLVKSLIDSTIEKPEIIYPSGRNLNVFLNNYLRIDEKIIAIENIKNVSDAQSTNLNFKVLSSSTYENLGSKGVNVVYKSFKGKMEVVSNFTLVDVYAHNIFLGPRYSHDFSLVLSLDYLASEREIMAFDLSPTAKNLTVETKTVNLLLGSRVLVNRKYILAEEFDTHGSKVISSFDIVTFPKCGNLIFSNYSNNNTFTLNEYVDVLYISEKDCTEDYFEFRDHNGIDKSENKIFNLTFKLQHLKKSSVITYNVYQQDSDDYIIDDSNVEIDEHFLSHPIAKFTVLSVPTNGKLFIATGDGYKEVHQFDKFPLNVFKDRLLRYRFVCEMQSSENVLLDELSLVMKAENGLILSNEIQLLFYSRKNHDNQPQVSFNLNLPWKFQSTNIQRIPNGYIRVYRYKFKSQDFNITSSDTSSIIYIKFNLYRLYFRSWKYIKFENLMSFNYHDLLAVHPEFIGKEIHSVKPDIDSLKNNNDPLKSFNFFTYLLYYDEITDKNRAICFVHSAKFSVQ